MTIFLNVSNFVAIKLTTICMLNKHEKLSLLWLHIFCCIDKLLMCRTLSLINYCLFVCRMKRINKFFLLHHIVSFIQSQQQQQQQHSTHHHHHHHHHHYHHTNNIIVLSSICDQHLTTERYLNSSSDTIVCQACIILLIILRISESFSPISELDSRLHRSIFLLLSKHHTIQ